MSVSRTSAVRETNQSALLWHQIALVNSIFFASGFNLLFELPLRRCGYRDMLWYSPIAYTTSCAQPWFIIGAQYHAACLINPLSEAGTVNYKAADYKEDASGYIK